jgi:large subunit ribosomal protein L25
MSEMILLAASRRETVGKQVRHMRREGQIPAVLYGPGYEPLNIAVDQRELRHALAQAGGTQLIELQVGRERIPSLARAVQRDPLRGDILHVDFYRVAMDRLITAEVPLQLINEAPLVENGAALLLHLINSVEVEALPASLPQHLEVDLSRLQEVGDQLLVRDLPTPEGVRVLADPDELVVRLEPPMAAAEEEELLVAPSAEDVEVITRRKPEEEEEG